MLDYIVYGQYLLILALWHGKRQWLDKEISLPIKTITIAKTKFCPLIAQEKQYVSLIKQHTINRQRTRFTIKTSYVTKRLIISRRLIDD